MKGMKTAIPRRTWRFWLVIGMVAALMAWAAATPGTFYAENVKPDAPTGLSAVSTADGVQLSWEAPTNVVATHYRVRRQEGSGQYQTIKRNTGSTSTTYEDTSVEQGIEYSYKVKAFRNRKSSRPSSVLSAQWTPPTTVDGSGTSGSSGGSESDQGDSAGGNSNGEGTETADETTSREIDYVTPVGEDSPAEHEGISYGIIQSVDERSAREYRMSLSVTGIEEDSDGETVDYIISVLMVDSNGDTVASCQGTGIGKSHEVLTVNSDKTWQKATDTGPDCQGGDYGVKIEVLTAGGQFIDSTTFSVALPTDGDSGQNQTDEGNSDESTGSRDSDQSGSGSQDSGDSSTGESSNDQTDQTGTPSDTGLGYIEPVHPTPPVAKALSFAIVENLGGAIGGRVLSERRRRRHRCRHQRAHRGLHHQRPPAGRRRRCGDRLSQQWDGVQQGAHHRLGIRLE